MQSLHSKFNSSFYDETTFYENFLKDLVQCPLKFLVNAPI